MRTFILALVVLALIVGGLFLTSIFLNRRTDALLSAAKSLPPLSARGNDFDTMDFYAPARRFSSLWTSSRKTIHFIIGHEEADRIEDTFIELQMRYLLRDGAGYMAQREKLLLAIDRLADAETLSFDSVT